MHYFFALVMAISVAQQPPAKPAAGALQTPATAATPPVQGPYEFTSDIGVFLIVVKTEKVAAFDAAMAKLKLAFAAKGASTDRRRQAAGWRVLKSMEAAAPAAVAAPATAATPAAPAAAPAPPATTTYLFFIEPVAKKVSYDPIEILRELLPNDVQSVYDQLKDSWVSATRIGLTELLRMGGGS